MIFQDVTLWPPIDAVLYLAMADAMVYAVALANKCRLIPSDVDLDALPQVIFIPGS